MYKAIFSGSTKFGWYCPECPRWLRAWSDLYVDNLTRLSDNLKLEHHAALKNKQINFENSPQKMQLCTHAKVRTKL